MSKTSTLTSGEYALQERFAISPLIDLEIDVGGEGWVGLAAGASHKLRQNLTASVIAEKLGYASVDYVRKQYLMDLSEHKSGDAYLRSLGAEHKMAYEGFYRSFQPPRKDAPLGVFAFDLTMVRAQSALELLIILARQGFLIEACLVARGVLEQIAYAAYVFDKISEKDVFEVKPQSLIKKLTSVCSSAGRAYGYLSQLAHFDPKLHYHFIGDEAGETINHRSWRFKIISTAWAFYMFHINFSVFSAAYSHYSNFSQVANLASSSLSKFDKHFEGVDNVWVHEIRALITAV